MACERTTVSREFELGCGAEQMASGVHWSRSQVALRSGDETSGYRYVRR